MSPRPTTTDRFEDDVRAMLARRAADVHPSRPPLDALDDLATLAALPARDAADGRAGPRRRRRGRTGPAGPGRRPLLAVAAAVLVVVGAVALVGTRGGDPPAERVTPAANPLGDAAARHPVPGDASYDPAPGTAVPLWPVVPDEPGMVGVDATDPRAVAGAYLATAVEPAAEPFHIVDDATVVADGVAAVRWEVPGTEPVKTGQVHLRQAGEETATWSVVGASTDPPALADVRTDGRTLAFAVRVSPTADGAGDALTVRVEVNGQHLPVGDQPLPGADGAGAGELVAARPGEWRYVTVPVSAGDQVSILVRHVGGAYLSASAVGLYVPPAPTAPR